MNQERVRTAVRSVGITALVIGLSGCGSSGPIEDAAPAADLVAPIDDSAEEADQDEEIDEDSAPSGGGGAGSIVIDGTVFDFIADLCFSEPDFLQISGPGVGADGVPFYGSISVNTNEDYDDDGVNDAAADVTLRLGAESGFDRSDGDMASYSASVVDSPTFSFAEFEYERAGDGQVNGSGEITDTNYVATASGEYVALEFSGGCG